jgi:hypothetical protein
MATLSSFKSVVAGNKLLQQTYYRVKFEGLSSIGNDIGASYTFDKNTFDQAYGDSTKWDLYVQATKMPGKTLTELELKRHAITFRMPNVVEWDGTWNCTVLLDLSMNMYKTLLAWQSWYSDIRNKDGGGNRGFPNVSATIEILDNNYNTVKGTMRLYGVYPKNVPALEFSQETSEYIKPDVEFGYSYADDMIANDPIGKSNS